MKHAEACFAPSGKTSRSLALTKVTLLLLLTCAFFAAGSLKAEAKRAIYRPSGDVSTSWNASPYYASNWFCVNDPISYGGSIEPTTDYKIYGGGVDTYATTLSGTAGDDSATRVTIYAYGRDVSEAQVSYSLDGGTTWSGSQTLTFPTSPPSPEPRVGPAWDYATWYGLIFAEDVGDIQMRISGSGDRADIFVAYLEIVYMQGKARAVYRPTSQPGEEGSWNWEAVNDLVMSPNLTNMNLGDYVFADPYETCEDTYKAQLQGNTPDTRTPCVVIHAYGYCGANDTIQASYSLDGSNWSDPLTLPLSTNPDTPTWASATWEIAGLLMASDLPSPSQGIYIRITRPTADNSEMKIYATYGEVVYYHYFAGGEEDYDFAYYGNIKWEYLFPSGDAGPNRWFAVGESPHFECVNKLENPPWSGSNLHLNTMAFNETFYMTDPVIVTGAVGIEPWIYGFDEGCLMRLSALLGGTWLTAQTSLLPNNLPGSWTYCGWQGNWTLTQLDALQTRFTKEASSPQVEPTIYGYKTKAIQVYPLY